MSNTNLETVTGRLVDLNDPNPKDICIEDIAWALSRLARYNGHTIQKRPYSVAQHSLVVSDLISKTWVPAPRAVDYKGLKTELELKALLHDAGEAYTGDISGPLKKIPELRPIIKAIEHKIDLAIYEGLNLTPPTEQDEKIIKEADLMAQRLEAYNFMVSRGMNWNGMPDVSVVQLQEFEQPKESLQAYDEFLERFNALNEYVQMVKEDM